jgi:hypothetical protein
MAQAAGIETLQACTLVMLRTNLYWYGILRFKVEILLFQNMKMPSLRAFSLCIPWHRASDRVIFDLSFSRNQIQNGNELRPSIQYRLTLKS